MTVLWLLLMFTTPHHTPWALKPLPHSFALSFLRSIFLPLSLSLYLSYTLQFANPTLSIFDAHFNVQPYLSLAFLRLFAFPLLLLFRFRISLFSNSDNPELHGDGRRQGQSPWRSLPLQDFWFPQRWFDLIHSNSLQLSIRAFFFRVCWNTRFHCLAIIARSPCLDPLNLNPRFVLRVNCAPDRRACSCLCGSAICLFFIFVFVFFPLCDFVSVFILIMG